MNTTCMPTNARRPHKYKGLSLKLSVLETGLHAKIILHVIIPIVQRIPIVVYLWFKSGFGVAG